MEICSTEGERTLGSLETFTECVRRSRSFYKSIQLVRVVNEVVFYHDQTAIPNNLKWSLKARSMSVHSMGNVKEMDLSKFIGTPQDDTYLHIACGKGIFRVKDHHDDSCSEYLLPGYTSWILSKSKVRDNHFIILPCNLFFIIAIEQLKSEQATIFPDENVPHQFDAELQMGKSVLFREPSNFNTLCLSAKFVHGVDKAHYPVQVAVFDYEKGMVLHHYICPRMCISNWQTPVTGCSKDTLINSVDQYTAYRDLSDLLKDRIVLSINTYQILKKLRIDITSLAGIRDLQTSNTFRIIAPHYKDREITHTKWTLQSLVKSELMCVAKQNYSNCAEEAGLILDLFRIVQHIWKDIKPASIIRQQHEIDVVTPEALNCDNMKSKSLIYHESIAGISGSDNHIVRSEERTTEDANIVEADRITDVHMEAVTVPSESTDVDGVFDKEEYPEMPIVFKRRSAIKRHRR